MPFLLRVIRKARWLASPDIPWLARGSLQADAIVDLKTSDNELSVWHIENDKSNLDQVVTAVASNRDQPSNLDYALLDASFLSKLGVTLEEAKGDTPVDRANSDWHRNMVKLTARKLVEFAELVAQHAAKERISEKRIRSLIQKAITVGAVDRGKIKPSLLEKIIPP